MQLLGIRIAGDDGPFGAHGRNEISQQHHHRDEEDGAGQGEYYRYYKGQSILAGGNYRTKKGPRGSLRRYPRQQNGRRRPVQLTTLEYLARRDRKDFPMWL